MLDFPVSWLVFALAAAAGVLLVFGFPRWRVRHRDASAPPALASVRVHRLPVHAALPPPAHCWLNIPVNRCAYFMSCWQDLLVHGLLISLVHRVWIALPQVRVSRKRESARICHLFPLLHTGSPWFCTSCPQGSAQRKRGPGIADIFLAAKTLALDRAYDHAQARILTLLQRALSAAMSRRWQALTGQDWLSRTMGV